MYPNNVAINDDLKSWQLIVRKYCLTNCSVGAKHLNIQNSKKFEIARMLKLTFASVIIYSKKFNG